MDGDDLILIVNRECREKQVREQMEYEKYGIRRESRNVLVLTDLGQILYLHAYFVWLMQ